MTLQLRTKREIMSFSGLADGLKSVAKGRVVLSINRNMHNEGRGEIERQWGRGKGTELSRIKVNSNEAAADRCSLALPVLATMANLNAAVSRQSRCLCPYPCLCPYHYSCSYSSCCLSFALLGQQWASKLKENTTKFHKLQLMFNELRWCLCQGAYAPLPMPLCLSLSPSLPISLSLLLLCQNFVRQLS